MNAAEGKSNLLKNTYVKNILSALAVAAIGFVLLNLTFLLSYLVFQFIDIFIPGNRESAPQWIPLARHILFLAIIALISWVVFRSKLPVLIKAIFMTVPTAVTIVTIGIVSYPSPVLPYLFGSLLTIGVLFYFFRTHKPWLYYYSVILVVLTLMIFTLMGGEI
ncbi:MAG: hypothetical protein C4542_00165 [Dehalococcoidia bacterium]|nr:MAG: hypothetical protein C4542_00165 [Dehalococcoidia bacterium]